MKTPGPHRRPLLVLALIAVAAIGAWPALATAGPRRTAAALDSGGRAEWEEGCGRIAEFAAERGRQADQGRGAFDPVTGADHRNWPPDPLVEYRHLRLDLDLVDMERARFEGVATYRIAPIGLPVEGLTLDCSGLEVKWIRWGEGSPRAGESIEYFHDGSRLGLRFPAPLPPGESVISIRYSGDRPVRGLIFTPSVPGATGAHAAAEVHSQGQTESNHHWFPCHDFPNVRMPVDLFITAPAGMSVSGNGALVTRAAAPEGGATGDAPATEPREIWHWRQAEPIVPYLVAIVAGRFARVPLAAPESGVSMHVWVPPDRVDDVERTFRNTDAMVALFERVFGQKYPWARYDQLVVRNFAAGGMENVAATTLHPGSLFDEIAGEEEDLDGLIAHELCHQWTGDLVTCRTWAHIWLNEGWATYGSALWAQVRDGPDGYFDSMFGNFGVAHRDSTEGAVPMVSPVYRQPWETFTRAPNPYPKGASILHMLRERLGDEVFFAGVHRYMAEHAGGLVETDDFRKAMEAASGASLEWFFDQWCHRPGCPNLRAEVTYDAPSRLLRVKVQQTQKIDERTPAFRLSLPIHVETVSGARTVPWEIHERSAEREIELDGPPTLVAIDPRLQALKTIDLVMATDLLIACARRGPTEAARRGAIEALASRCEPAVVETLAEIAGDTSRHPSSRRRAIEALAGFATPEALAHLRSMFDAGERDVRVRVALVAALEKQPREEAASRLESVALQDRSYQCRAAAARGLAAIRASDRPQAIEALVALTSVPSHQERVRLAAIEALAELGDLRALDAALALSRRGNFDRARPEAIRVLQRLTPSADAEARARVIDSLVSMLDDPERRSRDAAGEALAALKAAEAAEKLQWIASNDRDPGRRERADRWLRAIRNSEEPARTP